MPYKLPFALTLSCALLLSACSDKNDTSVSLSASDGTTASAPATAQDALPQTLTSKDGKVTIAVDAGNFTESEEAPASENITLQQYDGATDITLTVNSFGTPKHSEAAYFAKLTELLKKDSTLQNLQVTAPDNNKMAYSFVQKSGDETLNERCVASYTPKALYSVCAFSPTATSDSLAGALKTGNITINP